MLSLLNAKTSCWVKGAENVYENTFSASKSNALGAKEKVISCLLIFHQDKEFRVTADGDQCWENWID